MADDVNITPGSGTYVVGDETWAPTEARRIDRVVFWDDEAGHELRAFADPAVAAQVPAHVDEAVRRESERRLFGDSVQGAPLTASSLVSAIRALREAERSVRHETRSVFDTDLGAIDYAALSPDALVRLVRDCRTTYIATQILQRWLMATAERTTLWPRRDQPLPLRALDLEAADGQA